MNRVLAAIDLGSNSFHLSIVRIEAGQKRKVLLRKKFKVQLRRGVLDNGELLQSTKLTALNCLKDFALELQRFHVNAVTAIGTHSFRKLTHNHDFLNAAEAALGHPISIISGEEEARLIYLGALSFQDFNVRHLVIDIGGGSTELIIGENQHILSLHSVEMGSLSFQQSFFSDGVLTLERFNAAIFEVERLLLPIKETLLNLGWEACVGSAGTCKAVAAVLSEAGWKQGRITPQGLRYLRDQLIDFKLVANIKLPGLREDRESVLAGGLAILLGLFQTLEMSELKLSQGAIREGMLQELIMQTMEKSA